MMTLSTDGIAGCTGGTVERTAAGKAVGFSTDSRGLRPGELFVALRGVNFDGFNFLAQAFGRGAWGALVEAESWARADRSRLAEDYPDRAVVAVDDTGRALGDLAACHRSGMEARVVGVTGSNGKTTTKEMIAAIAAQRWKVHKNRGNLNNLIGLPLTLLELEESHEVAVLEMGMNRRGEIARLAEIASPEIGVVTNVGAVHLEHLGSLEAVAAAKAELLQSLGARGTAVLNADDPMTPVLRRAASCPALTFGLRPGSDFRAEKIRYLPGGAVFSLDFGGTRTEVAMPFIGEHNVCNALAAAAAACALGCDVDDTCAALAAARPVPMRFDVLTFDGGIQIINDAYNANPVSMKAALASLGLIGAKGRRAVVLGDMLELGEQSEEAHRALGRAAAAAGVELLVAVGTFSGQVERGAAEGGLAGEKVRTAADGSEAAAILSRWLREGDLVLLKGSRGVQLEKVLERLLQEGTLTGAEG